MNRVCIDVDHQLMDGTCLRARRVVDLDAIPADHRILAQSVVDRMLADLTWLGLHDDDLRLLVLGAAVLQEADEAAYRRVCEQRGVLAL